MKKRGFTLIELLAVIVILAIIALIATPIILGIVEDARKSAAGSSALGFIDAIEKDIALSGLDDNKKVYPTGNNLDISAYGDVIVKGNAPTAGWISVANNYVILKADLCVDGYRVQLTGHKVDEVKKGDCDNIG